MKIFDIIKNLGRDDAYSKKYEKKAHKYKESDYVTPPNRDKDKKYRCSKCGNVFKSDTKVIGWPVCKNCE